MEYGSAITKDTLRSVLDNTPDTRENMAVRQRLMELITRKSLQPVPFTYSAIYANAVGTNTNNLAAGATNQIQNVNIQADADFLILNQTYDCNTASAARTVSTAVLPNAGVTMIDTGSGYQYMDAPVAVPSIFGNGQFPYILPNPKLMVAKSTLQVLVTNWDFAAGINLRLYFNGVKLLSFN